MRKNDFELTLTGYHGDDAAVVIPEGVKAIDSHAFSDNETMKSLVIPEGVTDIEAYAFCDCSALEEVTLPATLEEWYWNAFEGCTSLKLFRVPAGSWVRQIPGILGAAAVDMEGRPLPPVAVNEKEWLYEVHGSEVTLTGRAYSRSGTLYPVEDSATTLYIPAKLEGKIVTVIGENAFANDDEIDALYLPDGLQRIEKGAFAECSMMDVIRVPDSLRYIAPGAFHDCVLLNETEERLGEIEGYDPDAEEYEYEDEDEGNVIAVSFGNPSVEDAFDALNRWLFDKLSDDDEEDEEDYEDDERYRKYLQNYGEELEDLEMPQDDIRKLYDLVYSGEKLKAIVLLRQYAPSLVWVKNKVEEIMDRL